MAGNFVQLHNHTHYSLLDGASKVPDLVKRVKELDMPAVGITDHGNMHGAYELWRAAVDSGVKPIPTQDDGCGACACSWTAAVSRSTSTAASRS